jgi:hypothetical protein
VPGEGRMTMPNQERESVKGRGGAVHTFEYQLISYTGKETGDAGPQPFAVPRLLTVTG